ncbi:PREDICTED: uncharacterized protein LOC106109958 [Papilio polytes]|uniref:uncharacterized protein LOC106109958 n=1 Tax=Papilio polytes TaxID=76194 RepID=UPI0006762368|nr:PREDICTED: uncharacterized protein LOC106109958 [Papilio polytes]
MCAAREALTSHAPAPMSGSEDDGQAARDAGSETWQGTSGAAGEVLRAVFAWLNGAELWAAAHVCRGWRAAIESWLWRRALLPRAAPAHLAALRRARAAAALNSAHNIGESWAAWSWRREYWLAAACWRLAWRAPAAGGAAVAHAALSHAGDRLALAADDASLTVWARVSGSPRWEQCWHRSERARGWAAVLAVSWAPDDARLLLSGPLVLADRWELLVLRFDESGVGRAEVRAECGPGGGCWAGPAAFLSLSLRLLAPARAVTTVWLNAADQGVQSEFAGVRSPVLRVYNEAAAHITHMLAAEVPVHELEELEGRSPEERLVAADEPTEVPSDGAECPRPSYWRATLPMRAEQYERVVLAAVGAAGGTRGAACALAVWALRTRAPPPLFATTSLAERVRAYREARLAPPAPGEPPAPPPSERELRALCTPPLATCRLPSAILGVKIHPKSVSNLISSWWYHHVSTPRHIAPIYMDFIFIFFYGGCVWAVCGAGAQCASLPALRPLLRVPLAAPAAPASPPALYLLQPSVCDDFLVTPEGPGSGAVRVVAARSGARGAALPHAAPPVAALLPASPTHLLVLAGVDVSSVTT